MTVSRKIARWGVAAAVLVLAIGVGPGLGQAPGPLTVAQVANYKANDRQARLEEGAKKEGGLLLYTSMDLEESQPLMEGFTKKYPFIKGEVYRASGEDVAQKLITEYRGRKYVADLFEGTGVDVAKMLNEGYGQPYFTPRAASYPRQGQDSKGLWVSTRFNMLAMGWNTTLVPAADVPKKYEDLLEARWRGKIGIEADDQIWLATLLEHWGESRAMEFFRRLQEQQLLIRKGHTLLANLVVAGEVPLSPTLYNHRPQVLKRRGAPIDWRPLEPVVAVIHVVSMPKNAPHPHAAMLFIDYLLSPEGQQALAKLGRIPAHSFVNADPPELNRGFVYKALDPVVFLQKYARYDQLWQEMVIRRR
jgi:iron(III) transport system substrate-binding protein